MCNIYRIPFNQAKAGIIAANNGQPFKIDTLGRQKKLTISVVGPNIHVVNSKETQYKFNENEWNKVMDRIDDLPDEEIEKTQSYVYGKSPYSWNNGNNQNFPSIPAIVRHLIENNLL